ENLQGLFFNPSIALNMASPLENVDPDVNLNIIFRDGTNYEGNPLHVHSNVMRKSTFLQEKLYACSSSNAKPVDINVRVHDNTADPYIKCIGVMYSSYYGEPISFSDAENAIDILQVAWEWQFDDGIRASMQFGVEVLLPYLSLTLGGGAHEIESLLVLHDNLEKALEKEADPQLQDNIMEVMKEYVISNFDAEASVDLRDAWVNLLLEKCRSTIEEIKCVDMPEWRNSSCYFLLWMLNLIEICDGEMFRAALGILSEDREFVEMLAMEGEVDTYGFSRLLSILDAKFVKDFADKCII
ncbi:hypothetical protein KI387_039227, partial [Taxus chinensis]